MYQVKPIPTLDKTSAVEAPPAAATPPLYHWLGADAERLAQEVARDVLDPLSFYHWLGADAEAAARKTRG